MSYRTNILCGISTGSLSEDDFFEEPVFQDSPTNPNNSNKVNYITIKVADQVCSFNGGELDGQIFKRGASVLIDSESHLIMENLVPDLNLSSNPYHGFWSLHRTTAKNHPAVICSYYNKRTQMIERRYLKIFFKDGIYKCGPRFPKKVPVNGYF